MRQFDSRPCFSSTNRHMSKEMTKETESVRGLEGLKVLDFSWVTAGPVTTRFLGGHGATIVKIESSVKLDIGRSQPEMFGGIRGINRCSSFDAHNSDKLGMTLDLTTSEGQTIARKLANWADVIVENFAPGTLQRWGLSYQDFKEIKPDVIMLSFSMQGQTGPHSRQAGLGTELQSLIGFTNFLRWPDRPVSTIAFAYTDFIVPWYGIVALIAAVEYRRRTGQGAHIDISQLEPGLNFLASPIMEYCANGKIEPANGNRARDAAPHGAYRCLGTDRWCTIAVTSETEWASFSTAVGNPAWVGEDRFATLTSRRKNEDELDSLVESWTVGRTAESVVEIMQKARVPAGIVAMGSDLHADPQLRHRKHFNLVQHPEVGLHSYETPSWRLSRTPYQTRMPSPCLGEHTEYICRQILGMSTDDFLTLWDKGVFK